MTGFFVIGLRPAACGGKYSQKIPTENLPNIRFAEPALQEFFRDERQPRNVIESLRCLADPVKIRAETDIVDPHELRDVFDVIDKERERRPYGLDLPVEQ